MAAIPSSSSPRVAYAELQAMTNFSFLEGASHPHELIVRAAELGLHAIAVTDRNSLAGIVRAHLAARELGMKLIVGCRLSFQDGTPGLLCYPSDRAAYGRLCRLLTLGKSKKAAHAAKMPNGDARCVSLNSSVVTPESACGAYPGSRSDTGSLACDEIPDRAPIAPVRDDDTPKGECHLYFEDFLKYSEGQIIAVLPPQDLFRNQNKLEEFEASLKRLRQPLEGRVYLAARRRLRGGDARQLHGLAALADTLSLPLLATNDVLYHDAARRRLQDILTCIREGCTIDEAGFRLARNAERHLKPPAEMARLFADYPEAIANTVELADRCSFSLEELKYEYPDEIAPNGEDPQARLERLTWEGLKRRYAEGAPEAVTRQVRHEFDLIARRNYAPFFLTVEDIVRFAREKQILHQGRGSAANSAVCYALGITEVDPARSNLLFERFISDARDEPPDIDVDFEHERREEVIQHIYRRFGRHRAGLCATVVCYRARGAVREVGKALGLSPDVTAALAGSVWGGSEEGPDGAQIKKLGLDAQDERLRLCLELSRELIGFPRHLSQHPGGFLIARHRLDELAPIENAAMEDRTIVSWDKDDIEALGMLKVDVLALGMLTCLAKGFALLKKHYGLDLTPATVPAEDHAVYDMLSRADSVGVFQVESRAQQTMLPRLKPRCFYDLVIEVAIVRPGPIQGEMVHPYLRRRQGLEPLVYPREELKAILEKTLGVPLFQEQCMKIAMVAAGFSASRADELRRAMATFKKVGLIHTFRDEFIEGMLARGYEREFAERCFSQIQGFGTYGFPESHAASFALLVYCSAWLKCHYPDVFAAAILNSQPMGFYAPAQLVRDAREHGVEVRSVDVNASEWDHALEPLPPASSKEKSRHALRLGFRLVSGLREKDAKAIAEARKKGGLFGSAEDVMRRTSLKPSAMLTLARAEAFGSLDLDRRESLWSVSGLESDGLPLFGCDDASAGRARPLGAGGPIDLPAMRDEQAVTEDYSIFGLSLRSHPMSFARPFLRAEGAVATTDLKSLSDGCFVKIAGLVLFRQQPGTAKGTIFMTIEDETGTANLIVWPKIAEKYRRAVFSAKALLCEGVLQKEGNVIHVVSRRLLDWTCALGKLHAEDEALNRDKRTKKRVNSSWMDALKSRDFR